MQYEIRLEKLDQFESLEYSQLVDVSIDSNNIGTCEVLKYDDGHYGLLDVRQAIDSTMFVHYNINTTVTPVFEGLSLTAEPSEDCNAIQFKHVIA